MEDFPGFKSQTVAFFWAQAMSWIYQAIRRRFFLAIRISHETADFCFDWDEALLSRV